MAISDSIKKIVESAIELETDGVKFYEDAADKMEHPYGKALFKSFVDEEKKHIEKINKLFAGEIHSENLSSVIEGSKSLERLKDVFHAMYKDGDVVINPNSDDLDAIRSAIEFEKKGGDVFDNAISASKNQAEKEVLMFLANEEKAHKTILENMLHELQNHYKSDARKEQRSQKDWANKIFARSDAQIKRD